jgi:hypothetical protein
LNWYRKKFEQVDKVFLTHKIVTKLSEIWVGDPGSEIRDQKNLFLDPDPGVKKAPDPGSGSATLIQIFKKDIYNVDPFLSIS